jgi:hypothetical protein
VFWRGAGAATGLVVWVVGVSFLRAPGEVSFPAWAAGATSANPSAVAVSRFSRMCDNASPNG